MLRDLVVKKILEVGREAASEYFGVTPLRVDQWRNGSKPISLAAVEKVFAERAEVNLAVELPAWSGDKKFLYLLLPWYKHTAPYTAFSIFGLLDREKMSILMNFGDAFIAHSRNTLARQFLKSGGEWALFVDDDMILPIGNAGWFNRVTGMGLPDKFAGLHTINRLLSHGKTLVGGVYVGRTADGRFMFAEGAEPWAADLRKGPRDEIRPTKWVATGCMLVHRSVFEDIAKKFPHLANEWFSTSEHDLVNASRAALAVLGDSKVDPAARIEKARGLIGQVSSSNGRPGTGEDVIFCIRAGQAGHQPHVDFGLWCGHIGQAVYHPLNTRPK